MELAEIELSHICSGSLLPTRGNGNKPTGCDACRLDLLLLSHSEKKTKKNCKTQEKDTLRRA